MIENISTFEELSDYWSGGDGILLLDVAAGEGVRHTGPVLFATTSSSGYWYGQVNLLVPERVAQKHYVAEVMGRHGINLTARADITDPATPDRFRRLLFSFVMTKDEWPLMAVREKLSAP